MRVKQLVFHMDSVLDVRCDWRDGDVSHGLFHLRRM